ncbi:penicillin-binding protein 2 [Candidatus Pantoea edessiphila]|uniref:Peptidoglycan D,D-transpeptidase MrdA n=1 Tax=Candidatus Pantoea edessiphila TaxID=2044610 RepID=A0A2P5T298_9GAMM|nr:penicillin-binding protein 2 [Candidatus Pantoea edessiphila]PPI88715.1 penicillin-binding protein 2 [Candidatus Pantoea edessiphila]
MNFNNRNNGKNISIRRILIGFSFILIVLCVILVNIYYLQVINFKEYTIQAKKNYVKLIPIEPSRGTIYDCNGIALAINRNSYKIQFILKKIHDLNKTFLNLSKIFDLTDSDFKNLKKELIKGFNVIDIPLGSQVNITKLAKFTANKHLFPGVRIKKYQIRYYPFGKTLSHIIGYISNINNKDINNLTKIKKRDNYLGTKNIGKLGIEAYYEDVLHGNIGYRKIKINSRGYKLRELRKKPPISGNDIYLTIDLKLQQYIEKIVANKGRIAVIASNPKTGAILAMVSIPSFNANLFVKGISNKDYNILLKDKNFPLYNRVIQAIYPPASTVKPYMALTALNAGIISSDTTIFDPGWWKLPGSKKYYRDWKKSGHGYLDVIKSIEESSDTFFYQVSYNMGIDYINEWMTKFGFGKHTGIDLFQENIGNMPTRKWKVDNFQKPWYKGDTVPIGIGQGYWTSTPLQMNKALMTLINNGIVKIPHILHFITDINSNILYNKPFTKNAITSNSKYWNIVKYGMYGVANHVNGTAYHNFANAPYKVAAKSGTAQVFGLKKSEIYNSYKIQENLRDHKLMNAYAPYDKPRIAVTIIMENSNNNHKIGLVMRKILDYYLINKSK